jgi:hypothetical protein
MLKLLWNIMQQCTMRSSALSQSGLADGIVSPLTILNRSYFVAQPLSTHSDLIDMAYKLLPMWVGCIEPHPADFAFLCRYLKTKALKLCHLSWDKLGGYSTDSSIIDFSNNVYIWKSYFSLEDCCSTKERTRISSQPKKKLSQTGIHYTTPQHKCVNFSLAISQTNF